MPQSEHLTFNLKLQASRLQVEAPGFNRCQFKIPSLNWPGRASKQPDKQTRQAGQAGPLPKSETKRLQKLTRKPDQNPGFGAILSTIVEWDALQLTLVLNSSRQAGQAGRADSPGGMRFKAKRPIEFMCTGRAS